MPNGFQELVLKILEGQQRQLDQLLSEIHGGNLPGLKQLTIEAQSRLKALESIVEGHAEHLERHRTRLEQSDQVVRDVDSLRDDKKERRDVFTRIAIGVILLVIGAAIGRLA